MGKSQYKKPFRVKKKKPIWKTKLFWRAFFALVFLGEVFYSVYFFIPFQIKEIIIAGNEKVGTADIKDSIENKIDKKILFFQTKSIFLADSGKMERDILSGFPQIGEADVKRKLPDKVLVSVEERKPSAVFTDDSEKFFIDKEGVVFELVSEESQLLKIAAEDRPLLNLGQMVLERNLMAAILEIEDKMKNELKIPINEVLMVSDDRLNVKTSEGWEIYFNPQKEISWQLTKLKAVLEKEISPERRKNLDYIDVRFGNLAPYK